MHENKTSASAGVLDRIGLIEQADKTEHSELTGGALVGGPAIVPHAQEEPGLEGVTLGDFNSYLPKHVYIYMPTREPWPASSVNARIGPVPLVDSDGEPVLDGKGRQILVSASTWLDQNRPVEQMSWAPGLPSLVRDQLISEGGWIKRHKVTCLNLYKPPTIISGTAAEAGAWLDHVRKVFGDNADHIIKWCAHRVQKPQEKINHAIVLGGDQGIGKDTSLEPVKRAVGPWNFCEVSPSNCWDGLTASLRVSSCE
jgi:hypothetical protein